VMMAKHKVAFTQAHAFDFAALAALPATTLRPTLEYDAQPHKLRGPLLSEVLKASGAVLGTSTELMARAVDGYAVQIPVTEAIQRGFIVATHLDDRPLGLGGLGPLWLVCDPMRSSDTAAQPLTQRFARCPWAAYLFELRAG